MGRSTSPASAWPAITPSDTVAITGGAPAAIVCEGAGDAVLVDWLGNTMTLAMEAGVVYPLGPVRINATNTTATGIKALYNEAF